MCSPWFSVINPGFLNDYVAELEPQDPVEGPVPVDDGTNNSLPPPPPLLASPLTASQAITQAISDLAADSDLNDQRGLTSGSFDLNAGDSVEYDIFGDMDWVVPFDGGGGANDVTGALLIDALSGVIDQATWIDLSQDFVDGMPISSITLAELHQMYLDEQNGILPQDDPLAGDLPVPEPGSAALLASALAAFAFRRRVGQARRPGPA
jgi:hypothetical protein